jgi:hypothetical protein
VLPIAPTIILIRGISSMANREVFLRLKNILLAIVGLCFLLSLTYVAWQKIKPAAQDLKSAAEAQIEATSSNLLERALVLGSATKEDLQKLKDAGGFENKENNSWRQYKAVSLDTLYETPTGKLDLMALRLRKDWPGYKLASFDNLRESLVRECGSAWNRHGDAIGNGGQGTYQCGIVSSLEGLVEITIVRKQSIVTATAIGAVSSNQLLPQENSKGTESCVETRVLEFRRVHGAEAPIRSDILQEYESDCSNLSGSRDAQGIVAQSHRVPSQLSDGFTGYWQCSGISGDVVRALYFGANGEYGSYAEGSNGVKVFFSGKWKADGNLVRTYIHNDKPIAWESSMDAQTRASLDSKLNQWRARGGDGWNEQRLELAQPNALKVIGTRWKDGRASEVSENSSRLNCVKLATNEYGIHAP